MKSTRRGFFGLLAGGLAGAYGAKKVSSSAGGIRIPDQHVPEIAMAIKAKPPRSRLDTMEQQILDDIMRDASEAMDRACLSGGVQVKQEAWPRWNNESQHPHWG